ncbi:MAG: helix-turn-helix transcriptional regulator [Kiritimatiellae bacterium]|nr:helix-turn-helix transcriptional regulator [Kiritimatiellia bacterium]
MSPRFAFPFPDDRFAVPPVHVVCVGTNDSFNYDYTRANVPGTALECVTGGEGRLTIGETEYRLRPGDVFILHGGAVTRTRADPGVRWRTDWFITTGRGPENVLAMYGLEQTCHIPAAGQERLFRRMFRVAERRQGSPRAVRNRLAALFYELVLELSSLEDRRRRGVSREAMRIKNYIDAHAEEPIRLDDIARAAGKSTVQTNRIFKREFGMPPYEYLLQHRMEIAKILLAARDIPVHTIAYRLHFSDPYHFSKTFKKRVGVPPSAYRVRP